MHPKLTSRLIKSVENNLDNVMYLHVEVSKQNLQFQTVYKLKHWLKPWGVEYFLRRTIGAVRTNEVHPNLVYMRIYSLPYYEFYNHVNMEPN